MALVPTKSIHSFRFCEARKVTRQKTRWGKSDFHSDLFFAVWLVFLFFFTLKIKKLHEVSKALEKSFKIRPIPLL